MYEISEIDEAAMRHQMISDGGLSVTENTQTRTEASKKPSEDLLLKLLDGDNDEQELVPSL